MTYREELERAIQTAQRRYSRWPSKARAGILRELLEDLRKLDHALQDSQAEAFRLELAEVRNRITHLEQAVSLRRLSGGQPAIPERRLA